MSSPVPGGRAVTKTFDPTPTPGGLSYPRALAIVREACKTGNIVGADLVEFAPIPGLHAFDYTAAAVAYKMLSYALA